MRLVLRRGGAVVGYIEGVVQLGHPGDAIGQGDGQNGYIVVAVHFHVSVQKRKAPLLRLDGQHPPGRADTLGKQNRVVPGVGAHVHDRHAPANPRADESRCLRLPDAVVEWSGRLPPPPQAESSFLSVSQIDKNLTNKEKWRIV